MKKLRRISIVSTRVRTFVVTKANSPNSWCPVCQTFGLMVTPDEAAAASGQSVRTIYRWLEAGRLHCSEEAADSLICLASLSPKNMEESIIESHPLN